MTTLHAKVSARPSLSTQELQARTGQSCSPGYDRWYADLERRIAASERRKKRREQLVVGGAALAVYAALVALAWWLA